jgi:ATP-binding cassette subfamily C protein
MRLLITFTRAYPLQSAIMLFALLLAGLAEGASLSALLPLLSIAAGSQPGSESAVAAGGSKLERAVTETLMAVGLTPTIGVLLGVIVAGIVTKNLLVLVANKKVGYTVARVATDLRLKLLRALLVSRWEYHLRQPVGSLANAMATEASRSSKAYLAGATIVALTIKALVYGGVAFMVSWRATLGCLVGSLIILYLLSRFIGKARRAGVRQTELLKSVLGRLTDSLQSIKPLKAMAREEQASKLLESNTKRLNRALEKQVFSKEAMRASQEPMITVFVAIGLYIALVNWQMPLTTVAVLVFLLLRLLTQLGKVQREYQQMVILESAYWSLQKTIREAEGERETVLGSQCATLESSIRLERVSFAYSEDWVLRKASMQVPAGSFAAIVGPSGVGKTTVADLVTGLLRPQEGEVWIDDLPLGQIDLRHWRRMIGYVPQETLLLHDTVMVNVTLGEPDLGEDEVEDALRSADVWDFVASMPQGIYSSVGERGGMLSGGQRQRIAIARALVHKPKLLILDEATSALDRESEAAICQTLQRLSGGLTILAISHQPALVKAADTAYSLDNGAIVRIKESPGSENGEDKSNFTVQAATAPVTGN